MEKVRPFIDDTDPVVIHRVDDEVDYLRDPISYASELYELYEERLDMLREMIENANTNDADDVVLSQLVDTLQRKEVASKLLPQDDPRSYDAVIQSLKERRDG